MKYERLFVLLVSLLVVSASLHETWLFYEKKPIGTVYPYVHGYIPDYYYYLSLIEQGREGRIALTTRYTSELYPRVPVQTFYAILGYVSAMFPFTTPQLYLLARILGGLGLIVAGYYLATKLFKDRSQRLLAFFLIIFGVPLWFAKDGQIWTVGNFWRGLEPLGRVSFIPHHLAANILLVGALVASARALQTSTFWSILLASTLGFLTGWTNPASVLALLTAIGCSFVFRISQYRKRIFTTLCIGIASIVPLIIFTLYQNTVFPWTEYKRIEPLWQYPLDVLTFAKILSISGLFALLAIPRVLKKQIALWDMVVGWFLWPFIGIGLLQEFVSVSNARYIQAAYYIPTSILAAVGIDVTMQWLKKRGIQTIISTPVIIIFFVIASLPSFYANIRFNEYTVSQDSQKLAMYPPKPIFDSIVWLSSIGKADDVVIAPGWISTITPALSNKRVILGHPTLTHESARKQYDMDLLYKFEDPKEVVRVIQTHRVYLIWADETLRVPPVYAGYMFIPVYTQSSIRYYQVKATQ